MKNKFFKEKRNRFRIIIAIFVGLLLIGGYACRDELTDLGEQAKASKAIENAKAWYAENRLGPTLLRSSDGMQQMPMKATWDHAFATKHGSLQVVETDIMSEGRVRYLNQECVDKYNETKDPKYMQSYTRMVFKTDMKTDETVGFLMTVIPNLDWLEKSNYKPFLDVTYLFRSKQFGGTILFHDLDGNFSNGWVYKKGKIVASVSDPDPGSDTIALRSTTCIETCYEVAYEYCYDVYVGNEDVQYYAYSGCDNVVLASGCYTQCYDDGSGSGESNVGPSNNNSSKASPKLTPIVNTKNISLDQNGIQALNDELDLMLEQCGYEKMYSLILSKKGQFSSVSINPSGDPGTYNAETKALTFQNNSSILSSFPEEFVHLFQDCAYANGIKSYCSTAKNNIEFEAKLMMDILCTISMDNGINPIGCWNYGAGKQYTDYYNNWVIELLKATKNHIPTVADLNQSRSIVDHNNKNPKNCNYLFFLTDFNAGNGNYGINSSLTPAAFQYFSNGQNGC